jgi:hypothetical protein
MTRILLKRAGNLVLRLLNSDGNEINTSREPVQTAFSVQALSIVNIQAGTLELLQLERLEPLEPGHWAAGKSLMERLEYLKPPEP